MKHSSRIFFSLLLTGALTTALSAQDTVMHSQKYNFTSFDPEPAGQQGNSTHPESGRNPYNTQCTDCMELIDKRTINSRYFIKNGTGGKTFYIQKSAGELHYTDSTGKLITIDTRLRPAPEPMTYSAPHQSMPTTLDMNDGSTTIKLPAFNLHFNVNPKIYHITSGSETPLFGNINLSSVTVGKDGAFIVNAWNNIDRTVIFSKGEIKTNFTLSTMPALPSSDGWLGFEDELTLPAGYTLIKDSVGTLTADGYWQGALKIINTASNQEVARWGSVVVYDNSGNHRGINNGAYQVINNGNIFYIRALVKVSWLKDPSTVYPVTIDPLVSGTTTWTAGDIGFTTYSPGNGFCATSTTYCYGGPLNITFPGQATITNVIWGLTYNARNTASTDEGGFRVVGPCGEDPSNTNWYYTCSGGGSTCTGSGFSAPFLATCLPPSCLPSVIPFYLKNIDCYTAGPFAVCSTFWLYTLVNTWIMTVEGQTLNQPTPPTSSGGTIICAGGTTTLTATGQYGTPAYTYSWSPTGGTTQSISISPTSTITYTCIITDACGVSASNMITITQTVITATVTGTNSTCGGSTGSATASASGGTGSYTYLWDNLQTGAVATNLSAGTYTVTVTDGSGCTATQTVAITASSTVTVSATFTNVLCFGDSSGTATATAAGGSGSYTYAWNPSGQTTSQATNLTSQTYSVTVTDGNGCTQTQTVAITEPSALTVSTTGTNVLCNGDSSGTAAATAAGGSGSFTYGWNPGGQTTSQATNLTSQTYSVTVTDGNGCTTTQTVAITQPLLLTVSVTAINPLCFGGNNGTATAIAAGGSGSYTYAWNPSGQTTSQASNLTSQTYSVAVTDANGCTSTQTVAITNPAAITLTASSTQATCTASNGTATAVVAGGSGLYAYAWNPGGQTTSQASNLISQAYSVTVTDANGCTATQTVSVTSNNPLTLSATSTPTGCNQNSGTATAVPTNSTAPYTYLWTGGQTTSVATAVAVGSYTVAVTDANGCTATQTVSVTQTPNPIVIVTATPSSITAGSSATLTATGGVTYSWSPATGLSCTTCANPTVTSTPLWGAGGLSYCATATDTNGCSNTVCVLLMVDIACEDIFIPSAFSPNNDGHNELECVRGTCIQTLSFSIFDRWGLKVFETTDPNNLCWDGIYKGIGMNSAVFMYSLEVTLTTGKRIVKKGNVSLIR